jgi:2-hydroxychromene-2-carboxylate isomerase
MSRTVDYYFSLASPWAYIGHAPFMDLVRRHDLVVNHKPMPLGRVFAETGGQALPQRHPVRQRYRLVELQRWRDRRGLSFSLKPRHWPFDPVPADRAVVAILAGHGDPDPFMRAAFAAIWEEERDLSDRAVLADLLSAAGHDADAVLEAADGTLAEAVYALNLENAVAGEVFGSPAYVLDGEVFWGQDRIELLADALASGRAAYRAPV